MVYIVEGSREDKGNDDCSFGGFLLVKSVVDVVREIGGSGVMFAESLW